MGCIVCKDNPCSYSCLAVTVPLSKFQLVTFYLSSLVTGATSCFWSVVIPVVLTSTLPLLYGINLVRC